MDLEEITHITLAVAEEHGVATYAPTLITGEQVQVIQGIPGDIPHREAIQTVILQNGLADHEYFFGVRSGPQEITTGHHTPQGTQFMRISALQQGFMVSTVEECPWWMPSGESSH
jgi:hypothetical protein